MVCIDLNYCCLALQEISVFLQKAAESLSQHPAAEIKHDTQLPLRATHQRSTHPLGAGDIHFIATSPFTARRALMFGGPVKFHLVFRWESVVIWSQVPCLSLWAEQSRRFKTGSPGLHTFDKNVRPTSWIHYTTTCPRAPWQILHISCSMVDLEIGHRINFLYCPIPLWRFIISLRPNTFNSLPNLSWLSSILLPSPFVLFLQTLSSSPHRH